MVLNEEENTKPSWLVRKGLGGCACLFCINLSVKKNKVKASLLKLIGRESQRLPPGQRITKKFPVLDIGIHPSFNPKTWYFNVEGEIERPTTWTWEEFQKLPKQEQISDFHCATSWSRLDVHWGGVAIKSIADIVKPKANAKYLIAMCADGGYSTNLSLKDALQDDVLLAYELDGKLLSIEHGGPVRLIVPKLYGWKSAKFLKSLVFTENDRPGYWESKGYNNRGDPWKEQRYDGKKPMFSTKKQD